MVTAVASTALSIYVVCILFLKYHPVLIVTMATGTCLLLVHLNVHYSNVCGGNTKTTTCGGSRCDTCVRKLNVRTYPDFGGRKASGASQKARGIGSS